MIRILKGIAVATVVVAVAGFYTILPLDVVGVPTGVAFAHGGEGSGGEGSGGSGGESEGRDGPGHDGAGRGADDATHEQEAAEAEQEHPAEVGHGHHADAADALERGQ